LKLVFKDAVVVIDEEIELEDDLDVVDEEDDELFD
jgi:archaeosine-15-forming tRNA-guanine transglycosylase